MKNKIFILVFVIILFCGSKAYGKTLGSVEMYNAVVGARIDGGLCVTYNIKLKINEDVQDRLDHIVFEVPNSNYKVLEKSVNVKDVIEEDSNHARINFNREYKAGSEISIKVKLTHYNMYKLNKNKNICMYNYTPGSIKEFSSPSVKVLWFKDKVLFSGTSKELDNNFLWEENLNFIKKLVARVHYNMEDLKVTEDGQMQYDFRYFITSGHVMFVIVGLIVVLEIILYFKRKRRY